MLWNTTPTVVRLKRDRIEIYFSPIVRPSEKTSRNISWVIKTSRNVSAGHLSTCVLLLLLLCSRGEELRVQRATDEGPNRMISSRLSVSPTWTAALENLRSNCIVRGGHLQRYIDVTVLYIIIFPSLGETISVWAQRRLSFLIVVQKLRRYRITMSSVPSKRSYSSIRARTH